VSPRAAVTRDHVHAALQPLDHTTFRGLLRRGNATVRRALALNVHLSPAMVEQLLEAGEGTTWQALATNPVPGRDVFDELANAAGPVRASLASNGALPHPVAQRLAHDASMAVRESLATATPYVAVQAALLSDPREPVRSSTAQSLLLHDALEPLAAQVNDAADGPPLMASSVRHHVTGSSAPPVTGNDAGDVVARLRAAHPWRMPYLPDAPLDELLFEGHLIALELSDATRRGVWWAQSRPAA